MISDRFPQESTGNSQEFIGKKFRPEYCFHFRCFPAGYGDFSAPFLQDPAGYGGRNLRPGELAKNPQLGTIKFITEENQQQHDGAVGGGDGHHSV
jgi:hypothetical protein